MAAPLFPVPPAAFAAEVTYRDFAAGDSLKLRPGVVVHTHPLRHPNGATGYRIEYAGRSICYVTDTEHIAGEIDQALVEFLRGADVFIYDSAYTDEEFEALAGHSTWQRAIRITLGQQVVLFHHDPGHDDAFMDRVAAEANTMRPVLWWRTKACVSSYDPYTY